MEGPVLFSLPEGLEVQRNFAATRPNQRWVSDRTYVATWRGVVYVDVVSDAFSRRIVGWRAARAPGCRHAKAIPLRPAHGGTTLGGRAKLYRGETSEAGKTKVASVFHLTAFTCHAVLGR